MNKQIQEIFVRNTTRVKSISFHPVYPTLITGNHCGTIYIWNYHYNQATYALREHVGSVRVVRFHPSGELFASGGDDKIVRVWNYKTREMVQQFRGHTDYVRSVDFHPTHPWLISGSDDYTIKIWNYYTGELLCSSAGHSHYIMSVLFLDSTHIVTASLDHTIGLWNCSNLFDKARKFMVPSVILYQTIEAHDRGVNTLWFGDGVLLSGADDREIKVWKYADDSLVPVKTLYSQEGNVTCVFSLGGTSLGVSEDGVIAMYHASGKVSKFEVGARLWAISGKDDYLAVGTDDGLRIFRNQERLLFDVSGDDVFYLGKGGVSRHSTKSRDSKGDELVCATSGRPERISAVGGGRLLLQYEGRYEMVDGGKKTEGDSGHAVVYNKREYKLQDGVLFRDGKSVAGDARGWIVGTCLGVFLVNGKGFRVFSDDDALDGRAYSGAFVIRDVKATEDCVAAIGVDRICLMDRSLSARHQISERVEIVGALFHSLSAGSSHDSVLIYATVRQIKYFYEEVGTLQSIGGYMVPVALVDSTLVCMTKNGLERMPLNMGEVEFRRAVSRDENILSIIEKEHLPGLSPLNYLVRKGKGAIALPYIKDSASRFALFLSDNDFEAAFELCESVKMYSDLGFKALKMGSYDVSERCFQKMGDSRLLFFLYLCTRQCEKMRGLEGGEIEVMARLVLEDAAVFDGMGVSLPPSDSGGVVGDIHSPEEKSKMSERLSSIGMHGEGAEADCGRAIRECRGESDVDDGSAGRRNALSGSEDPVAGAEGGQDSDDNYFREDTASDLSEEESTVVSNRTSIVTINDSEPRMHLFDPSLLRDVGVDNIDDAMEDALAMTTEGKFPLAVEKFRNIISFVAGRLKTAEDALECRKKIGVYLWGLCVEIERRKTDDTAKSIQMALFFSRLPLESKHAAMARMLAMTLCYKNQNFDTAKDIALGLPRGKVTSKILDSPRTGDRYEVCRGDLCFDTLCIETEWKTCPLCFVKSKKGDVCGACMVGLIE